MALTKRRDARPSKVVKPKHNARKTTVSYRNHSYKSFNDRIAGLKIDPIRRKRDNEEREELTDDRATYFGRSLARWRDLNLSQVFVSFATKAAPLADNLPLLLHNQEQVITLLLEHIERGDTLSLEPLLGLLSDFAHDLDTRFEPHFALAVRTVSAVAAKHQDPAVVEWSFNCLAWLFKYLSRLLAPDLRPVYDLMAPYIGKTQQKPYIVRFAAESMSFLLRKAAVNFERNPGPLETILEHIFQDLDISNDSFLYEQGVMVLLTDAVKGVQQNLHSTGPAILRTVFRVARARGTPSANRVVHGVLTSLIHSSTSATFAPILELVLEDCEHHTDVEGSHFSAQTLFVVVSVRKGTRIGDWARLLTVLASIIESDESVEALHSNAKKPVASTVAVTILYCSDGVRLVRSAIADKLLQDNWRRYFLGICDYVARIDRERFNRVLVDKLQSFARSADGDEATAMLRLLPALLGGVQIKKLQIDDAVAQELVARLQVIENGTESEDDTLATANIILQALPYIQLSSKLTGQLRNSLDRALQPYMTTEEIQKSPTSIFVLGSVLKQWLATTEPNVLSTELFQNICRAAHSHFDLPAYWVNLLTIITTIDSSALEQDALIQLRSAVPRALCLSDRSMRQTALDVLQKIYEKTGQAVPSTVSTAILIESTPISLETARSISMNIRRLGSEFAASEQDADVARATTSYCLGLLHIRLSQAWDDAIDALEQICKTSVGEQAMMQTIQEWLFQQPSTVQAPSETVLIDADAPQFKVNSDFECPTLARMEALSAQVFDDENAGRPDALTQLHTDLEPVPTISTDARSQALRVLAKLHSVAEKRSRLIVPTLLKWAGSESDTSEEFSSADRWNRKDQKSMLHVFAQFQNPKVLFKSAEVYDALLQLCKNGDVEIQKAALKALLAWKTPEIVRYEEHLSALLDETRFREELSVFLQGNEEEGLREADLPTVMPVLLRLLYGRLIGGGKEGQQAKRKAVFVALSSFPAHVLETFINIALSSTKDICFTADGAFVDASSSQLSMPLRQQLGMLNMFGDMIDTLGSALKPYAASMLNSFVGCTVIASRKLRAEDGELSDASLLRSVRQNGLQGLYKLFNSIDDDFKSECQTIVKELLLYRLDKFVSENGQGISATLRIISAWAASNNYVNFLIAADDAILTTLADLLTSQTAKDEVRLFLLNEVFDPLLNNNAFAQTSSSVVGKLAQCISIMLSRQPEKALLDSCVKVLQLLASNIDDEEQVASILTACQTLLVQPSQVVSIKVKLGLLRTMVPMLDKFEAASSPGLYHAVCGLFSRLHDLAGRALLSEVFTNLSKTSGSRQEVAVICQQLNKVNSERLDQPDFETREQGFVRIYETATTWTAEQWTPIVHNCLYFLRDPEDTVNRASAAKVLRMLVTTSGENDTLSGLVQEDLFGAIQRGMSLKSEFVRAEYLNLLHAIVMQYKDWREVSDMQSLAFDGDDEASFFTNVLHIQQHRRLRALRRLGEIGAVSSRNIVRIFLPLLEQFIFDQAEGDSGRTLSDQTVQTIGQLAKRLRWSDLRKVLLRYYGYLKTKDDLEKTVLRLIGALIDGLTAALASKEDAMTEADDDVITSLPQNRINVILKEYLPPLQTFLHQKDDSKVDRRVAVAISIVKLARLLPEEDFSMKLAPTLTDIAHILRSRDLEAREQTRRTLSTILGIVGPQYLQFILKELRSALQRGYQLHVLSYSVHHLLVTNGPEFKPGDIDECIPQLSSIILDDIFGITGQEKDAEEYKSGMKEVKSSKSYDTMEIVARMASVTALGQLVLPVRSLLQERLDSRLVKKIDDLLLRVRRGIDQNPEADNRDMLVFCHELVRQVYAQKSQAGIEDWKLKKYLAQTRGPPGSSKKGSTTSYLFKLTAFALALLRKVLRRHEDLQTSSNLAGFLPMIGDGLVAGETDVKIESAKLLSTILRVELPEIDAGIAVYLKEAIAMVKSSNSTINESARAGLDLATAILRERRDAELRDHDVAILLRAIKADIDEPDRQGQTFRFLRAVLGRKIVIPEVYDIMDEVARIMVNNSDEGVRQNARAAYIQFVVDFPQSKARWDKTTAFLVKNLGFEHAAGRKSVLEVVHTLLGRVNAEVTQEILLGLFVGLIQRVVSDTDSSCREMATVLVGRVLEKADDAQEDKIKSLASKWLQSDKDSIKQAAIKAWTITLRAGKANKKNIDTIVATLSSELTIFDSEENAGSKLSIASLDLLLALCETSAERAFAKDNRSIWSNVTKALHCDSTTCQSLAVSALTLLYNDVASTTAKSGSGLTSNLLQTSSGLRLDFQFWSQSCIEHLQCLRNTSPSEQEILSGVSRNLVFFGRLFAANSTQWKQPQGDQDDAESENEEDEQKEKSALGYLMSRLVYTTRREGISAITRLTALQTAAAIMQVVDDTIPNLKPLVRTLFILTDKSASQQSGQEHRLLVDKARETLDVVQSKVGSQKYIEMLSQARKEVNEKRDDRRQKRRIEAVSQPERWAKEKRRRNDAVKVRSRAKAELHRSQRRGW